MTVFHEGDLYGYTGEKPGSFRILFSDEAATYTVEVDTDKDVVPVETSTLILQDLFKQGEIKKINDSNLKLIEEEKLSKKQKEQRDFRFEIINGFWSRQREKKRFLKKNLRKELYEEIALKLGVSARRARSLVSSFFKGGMTPNSLIPKFTRRGGVGRERTRFRKSTGSEAGQSEEFVSITGVEREQFRDAYEKVVLGEGGKITEAYQYLLKTYYTRRITDEDGNQRTVFTKNEPNKRQFRYWIDKHRERDREAQSQKGQREFDNNYRVDMGSTREGTNGPGNLMEIDLMHCNITVVSEQDRNLIIGRPSLYTIIDVFSGMVAGFYLGIEKESWRTTAFTLMNLVEDKVSFCKAYGINIKEEEWPSCKLPQLIKADKGALNSPKVIEIRNNYSVDFKYARAYSPRQKPNIEHRHKGYKEYMESHLQKYGADQWNSGSRGVSDAREKACLTLDELRKIIIKLTLKFNKTINNHYPRTPGMMADCVSPSPVELWKWGLQEGLGTFHEVPDKEEFRLCLLEHTTRKIGKKGIQVNTHYYVPESLDSARIFNQNQGKKMEIVYNQEDITEVYLCFNKQFHRLKMKDFCEEYRGMSVVEDRSLRKRALRVDRTKLRREQLDQIDLDHFVREVAKDKEKIIPKSKKERKQRVSRIEENRSSYIHDLKREESLARGNKTAAVKTTPDRQEEDSSFNERRWKFIENALKEIEEESQKKDE